MRIRFLVALLLLAASPAGAASILYVGGLQQVSTSSSYYRTDFGGIHSGDAQDAPDPTRSWTSTLRGPLLVAALEPTEITLDLSVRRATSYSNTHYFGDPPHNLLYYESYFGPQDMAVARIEFRVTDPTPSVWTLDGVEWTQDLLPGVDYVINERLVYQINAGPAVVTRSFSMRLVPEPGTAALLGFGVAMLARQKSRKSRS